MYWILLILVFILYLYVKNNKIEHLTCAEEVKYEIGKNYAHIDDVYIKPYIVNELLTRIECNNIIDYVADTIDYDPVTGEKKVAAVYNRQLWIDKNDPLVKNIVERIAERSEMNFENAENVLVLKYLPFKTFKPNYDACCDETAKCNNVRQRNGIRVLTVEIYLNSDFNDGETVFPNIDNLKLKPELGGGVVIYPLAKNFTKCHPMAKRNSNQVTDGVKWTMNIWFTKK